MRPDSPCKRAAGWRRTRRSSIGLIVVAVVVAVIAALLGGSVGRQQAWAETPAERCARETAAYNSAWAQSWAASNGKPANQAPPPPVPYVCVDPGPPTSSTTPPPSVTAPVIPTDTDTPDSGGPNMGAHAPTDIPSAGATPIVPRPGGNEGDADASPSTSTAPGVQSGPSTTRPTSSPVPVRPPNDPGPRTPADPAGPIAAPPGWTDADVDTAALSELTANDLAGTFMATPAGLFDVPDSWKIPYYGARCAVALATLFLPLLRTPGFLVKLFQIGMKYPRVFKAAEALRKILMRNRIEKAEDGVVGKRLPAELKEWMTTYRNEVEFILEAFGILAVWTQCGKLIEIIGGGDNGGGSDSRDGEGGSGESRDSGSGGEGDQGGGSGDNDGGQQQQPPAVTPTATPTPTWTPTPTPTPTWTPPPTTTSQPPPPPADPPVSECKVKPEVCV